MKKWPACFLLAFVLAFLALPAHGEIIAMNASGVPNL